jgi:M6 family metalloprotease-like protein
MLVIYVQDLFYSPPFSRDAAWAADRFFGGTFRRVNHYFAAQSFGKSTLVPAIESEGTPGDGVVVAKLFYNNWLRLDDPGPRFKLALSTANPWVDYSSFDADSNDIVDNSELVVVIMSFDSRGTVGARANNGFRSDDGVWVSFYPAGVQTETDDITVMHEVGHSAYGTTDLYGFGVGSLDTWGAGGGLYIPNGWTKLHLGWISPRVVGEDGYYEIERADVSGEAFILHDPGRGTNDYFLVENRQRCPGSCGTNYVLPQCCYNDPPCAGCCAECFNYYDQNASDSGLVIWRVDDDKFGSNNEGVRPVEIMRPDGNRTHGCMDLDVDGREGEDPPALGWSIITGFIDVDGSGVIDANDNGFFWSSPDWPIISGLILQR